MTYETARALRTALEFRLQAASKETGVVLDRLRRRVLFERIVARLQLAEPGLWVLKGGMALEVRLRDAARSTKDIDVGLRQAVSDSADLHDRLIAALSVDPVGDRFMLEVGEPVQLREDDGGDVTWRVPVAAALADKHFGAIKLDVSPRPQELRDTDRLPLPNSLGFAGIPTIEIEIVDVHRHAAEKFHAMTRDHGDRENSRVRDLLDVVILIEHRLLAPAVVATAVRAVWAERNTAEPPRRLPPFPLSWPDRYEQLAENHDVDADTFSQAVTLVRDLWAQMFPNEEE
jgi:hypothetical protein